MPTSSTNQLMFHLSLIKTINNPHSSMWLVRNTLKLTTTLTAYLVYSLLMTFLHHKRKSYAQKVQKISKLLGRRTL
jgi:hypothetical protein